MKRNKGFSLVELMVAAGLIGALSLGVMQMNRTMSRGQATAEVKMETIEIRRQIVTTMADKLACENTLSGINLGGSVNAIKNKANKEVFTVGEKYGDNSLELEEIKIEDQSDLGFGMRKAKLIVKFKGLKKAAYGNETKSFESQLKVKSPSATGVISECYDDTTGTIATANETSCLSIGGVWDPSTSTCTISHFVRKSGDTMTGALEAPTINISGNLDSNTINANGKITSPKFCTGSNCKGVDELALSDQNCADNEIAIGIKPNGSIKCRSLTCPSNHYLRGMKPNGDIICEVLPTDTCPTNQYVTQVNSDGSVNCAPIPPNSNITCPSGKVIQSIAGGSPTCVDAGGNKLAGQKCPSGSTLQGFKADGSIFCSNENPINCIGQWSSCQKTTFTCSCIGKKYSCSGTQKYTVIQQSNSSGQDCAFSNGHSRSCQVPEPHMNHMCSK